MIPIVPIIIVGAGLTVVYAGANILLTITVATV